MEKHENVNTNTSLGLYLEKWRTSCNRNSLNASMSTIIHVFEDALRIGPWHTSLLRRKLRPFFNYAPHGQMEIILVWFTHSVFSSLLAVVHWMTFLIDEYFEMVSLNSTSDSVSFQQAWMLNRDDSRWFCLYCRSSLQRSAGRVYKSRLTLT
jgi:hypothetical protein